MFFCTCELQNMGHIAHLILVLKLFWLPLFVFQTLKDIIQGAGLEISQITNSILVLKLFWIPLFHIPNSRLFYRGIRLRKMGHMENLILALKNIFTSSGHFPKSPVIEGVGYRIRYSPRCKYEIHNPMECMGLCTMRNR